MSLKSKYVISILAVLTTSLLAFLYLSMQIFNADKMTYVYEMRRQSLDLVAHRLTEQIANTRQTLALATSTQDFFRDPDLQFLSRLRKRTGLLEIWEKNAFKQGASGLFQEQNTEFVGKVQSLFRYYNWENNETVFHVVNGQTVFMMKISDGLIALCEPNSRFSGLFKRKKDGSNFALTHKGKRVFGLDDLNLEPVSRLMLANKKVPEGMSRSLAAADVEAIVEEVTEFGKELIVAHKPLLNTNLLLVSMANKANLVTSSAVVFSKSAPAFFALLIIAVIFSLWLSDAMTKNINALVSVTEAISSGKFSERVEIISSDEIGKLSAQFNIMADKIKSLVNESAENTRLNKELEVASAVQEVLYPPTHFKFRGGELFGFVESATLCGGDWWYHFERGDDQYVLVADATGHGVSAALMTSAASSAISLLKRAPQISPAILLHEMNETILATSKNTMNMTMFVGCVNARSGLLTYANASHEVPLVIPSAIDTLSKENLIPLNGVAGPRLGEGGNTHYQESSLQLHVGDLVLFYSDGIFQIKNKQGREMSEGHFIRKVVEIASKDRSADGYVERLWPEVLSYHRQDHLDDDITMVALRYVGLK